MNNQNITPMTNHLYADATKRAVALHRAVEAAEKALPNGISSMGRHALKQVVKAAVEAYQAHLSRENTAPAPGPVAVMLTAITNAGLAQRVTDDAQAMNLLIGTYVPSERSLEWAAEQEPEREDWR